MSDHFLRGGQMRGAILLVLVTWVWAGQAQAAASLPAAQEYAVQPLAQVERQSFVSVTAAQMAQQDAQRDADDLPYRFALPVEVALNPTNSGTWERLPDGRFLWRLRLASPGVLSLNLGFTLLDLPTSARLLVYPADDPTGAQRCDNEDNGGHNQLWTPVFLTEELVVELLVAESERSLVALELGSIGRGYRLFGAEESSKSGACNVDVICPEGDNWRDEIDTVGLVQRNGSIVCTGFMINNTAADGRPLFMTADHCNVTASAAPTLVVYWNYQSPTCGEQGGGQLTQTSSGSTLLATAVNSDFTLVELDQVPAPEFGVKYAGWSREDAAPVGVVCIHQPRGDEKSISFEDDATSITSYLQNDVPGNGTHLRVTDWDLGTTEGGSSGSPLFNLNHRVIGQLHGGQAACGNDFSDWYGRFAISWTGGGTPATRLSDHLDPSGTGALTTDLYIPPQFQVLPFESAMSVGVQGGPFVPEEFEFTVANRGTVPVNFEVTASESWLMANTSGGSLDAGGEAVVTASLTAAATSLPLGVHQAELAFSDPDGGAVATSRTVSLRVEQNALTLLGPAPNPFTTPPVAIRYTLRGNATVSATVTNIRGFKVRDLGKFSGTPGDNTIPWDGLDDHGHQVPSGVYVIAVESLGHTFRKNVVYTH